MQGQVIDINMPEGFLQNIQQKDEEFLETIEIEIVREKYESLITRDFLRADVKAIFFVKIAKGANKDNAIKNRLISTLASGLRKAAATMELQDLEQNKEIFAQKVQEAVNIDILLNGLALESITIFSLGRTKDLLKRGIVIDKSKSLICKDFQRIDVKVYLFVKGKKDVIKDDAIKKYLDQKVVSALRSVAATMDLQEIQLNGKVFAQNVKKIVTNDFLLYGLELKSVYSVDISSLGSTEVDWIWI